MSDEPARTGASRDGTAADWLAADVGERPADLVVVGWPTPAGSTHRREAVSTPAAVREALASFATWCASLQLDLGEVAVVDRGDVSDLADVRLGDAPTVVLGDARSSVAEIVLAAGDAYAGVVVLGPRHDVDSIRRLGGRRMVQIGLADWATGRADCEEAEERGVIVLPRGEVAEEGVVTCVRQALDAAAASGSAHVVLDLGVCDRAVAPACPSGQPGGLSAEELLTVARVAGGDARVRTIALTGVDAGADVDGRTVRLAAMCVLEVAAGCALR